MSTRRQFIHNLSLAGVAISIPTAMSAIAADVPMLDEQDPVAHSLGYVTDAVRANSTKYPRYERGQNCSACAYFKGDVSSPASGSCPFYVGKHVASSGWCSGWSKRA